MNTLPKLCTEKKTGVLESEVKRLTQQLVEVRAAQKRLSLIDKLRRRP